MGRDSQRKPQVLIAGIVTWVLGLALAGPLARTAWSAPEDELERAQRLIQEDLRFQEAVVVLERALAEPEITRAQRVEAYRLLGIAHVAGGAIESAEASFFELLKLDPDYALDPLLSPKIRSVFDRVKSRTRPQVRLYDVTATPHGRRVVVLGRIEDAAGAVHRVELFARMGSEDFERVPMDVAEGQAEAAVPTPLLARIRLDYYVVGTDADGNVLAQAGSRESPLSVVVERPEIGSAGAAPTEDAATPWYAKWWVWTAVGAVVAGGVVAAVVLGSGDAAEPTGTLEPIRLELVPGNGRW